MGLCPCIWREKQHGAGGCRGAALEGPAGKGEEASLREILGSDPEPKERKVGAEEVGQGGLSGPAVCIGEIGIDRVTSSVKQVAGDL